MAEENRIFNVGFLNIRGQTGLSSAKQTQIDSFLVHNKLDVLNLQEINICDNSFSNCNQVSTSYNLLSNNSPTKYGTASLVKSDFTPENILLDTKGRCIVFNIGPLTLANLYLPSGNDAISRSSRENYFGEIIPQLLLNRLGSGCIGGDLNCIIDKRDCTHNPNTKMSPSLARMATTFNMKDSFRTLHPSSTSYSHFYYTAQQGMELQESTDPIPGEI